MRLRVILVFSSNCNMPDPKRNVISLEPAPPIVMGNMATIEEIRNKNKYSIIFSFPPIDLRIKKAQKV